MFTVLGHVIGLEGAAPYAAPIFSTKDGAINAFVKFALGNGEVPAVIALAAQQLRDSPIDTLIYAYDGDEWLVCTELQYA